MVYYGPWIDPPLIEELVTVSHADLTNGSRVVMREVVTAGGSTSGITFAWDRRKAEAFKINEADAIPSPTYPRQVWDIDLPGTLLNFAADTQIPTEDGSGFQQLAASYVRHTGSHGPVAPTFTTYSQGDSWHWGIVSWMLTQNPATPFYVPPERPTGATMAEFEEYGQPADLEAIALESVDLAGDAAHWTLRVLPGGDTAPASLRDSTWETVSELRGLTAVGGSYSLGADELAAMQAAMRPAGQPAAPEDARRVEFALTYSGPYPGDLPGAPEIAGPLGNNWAYAGDAALTLRVAYRVPRYRWVYDEVPYRIPPPRRIYPRDDGLTGGARRTWPPSKGYQYGSRVDGSGYL